MDRQRLKAAFVIAAGGAGTRMNAGVPKQFLEIAGKPILLHTIEAVSVLEAADQIVIALPVEHIPQAEALLAQQTLRIDVQCVPGGANRQESVHRGVLHTHPDVDVILVHDAVRPFCSRDMMERVLQAAWQSGAAVPGLPATETIQRVSPDGCVQATPPREELYAIQTPQAFHAGVLRAALDRAQKEGFLGTDESSVVRWAGHPVLVVPGSPDNIKITRPMDLDVAARLFARRTLLHEDYMNGPDLRIGQGIDYHRLVEGRKLILGGVEIPFEKGLEGHSDADALIHAICDALLGAVSKGDIGRHFPDTDPAYRGRNSLFFLKEVRAKIEKEGWAVRNVDATLLVQRPKIAPHAPLMQQNIAEALGLKIEDVSIKATTTEGMNAEGRGEGISAQAIVLLYKK